MATAEMLLPLFPEELMTVETNFDEFDKLEDILAEKAFYRDLIHLWEVVRKCGFDPSDVSSFMFVEGFLGESYKQRNREARDKDHYPPYSQSHYVNAIRHKDGNIVKMTITPRPKPPKNMKVDINEI